MWYGVRQCSLATSLNQAPYVQYLWTIFRQIWGYQESSKHSRKLLCNLRHQQSDSETAYTLLKYFLHEHAWGSGRNEVALRMRIASEDRRSAIKTQRWSARLRMMPVSCRSTIKTRNFIYDFAHRLVGEIGNANLLRIAYCYKGIVTSSLDNMKIFSRYINLTSMLIVDWSPLVQRIVALCLP